MFFVGVFQYDFGPPKHALELRDYVKYKLYNNVKIDNYFYKKNLLRRGRSSTLNVLFHFLSSGRGREVPRGTSCIPVFKNHEVN